MGDEVRVTLAVDCGEHAQFSEEGNVRIDDEIWVRVVPVETRRAGPRLKAPNRSRVQLSPRRLPSSKSRTTSCREPVRGVGSAHS